MGRKKKETHPWAVYRSGPEFCRRDLMQMLRIGYPSLKKILAEKEAAGELVPLPNGKYARSQVLKAFHLEEQLEFWKQDYEIERKLQQQTKEADKILEDPMMKMVIKAKIKKQILDQNSDDLLMKLL